MGYYFESLSPFRQSDIKLYFNRIARYELGKLQETYLDTVSVNEWPSDMGEINQKIAENIKFHTVNLSWFKTLLVKKRLNKLVKRA